MAGGSRIARAAGAAALSTLAALTMHVIAGGHAPAAAGVAVPLAVSFAVGVQLAGRPLGRWRLAVLLGASQVAFHAAFSLGAASPGAAAPHAHHGDLALGPLTETAHAAPMPLAHIAAAAVAYAGIRRADTLIAALRGLAATVGRAWASRLALGAPAGAPARSSATVAVRVIPALGRLALHSPAMRGPPAIA